MGCTTSRTEIQLGSVQPWEFYENGVKKNITREELSVLRKQFWETKRDGNPQVWEVLRRCCEAVLSGDMDTANTLLNENMITVLSGELDSVVSEDGTPYRTEKYCYSNPSNMVASEGLNPLPEHATKGSPMNNKFRFRISAGFLNEEREIILVFDGQEKSEKVYPGEPGTKSHNFYMAHHVAENLQTITDAEVKSKVIHIISNFPEVQEKHITLGNVRVFYLGRELCRTTPFVNNSIPFESIVVVLVQSS